MVKSKQINQLWTSEQKNSLFQSLKPKTIPTFFARVWTIKRKKLQRRGRKKKKRHWDFKGVNHTNKSSYWKIQKVNQGKGTNAQEKLNSFERPKTVILKDWKRGSKFGRAFDRERRNFKRQGNS